jgi:hypothetical protein
VCGEVGPGQNCSPRNSMTVPHYINEDKSDMRGIKSGWYGVEDDGNLSSGPFSNLEACVARITQPTNGTTASSCSEGRTEFTSLSTDIRR